MGVREGRVGKSRVWGSEKKGALHMEREEIRSRAGICELTSASESNLGIVGAVTGAALA